MKTAGELLKRYEVVKGRFKTRPLTENEIITRFWGEVCAELQECSFNESATAEEKRVLRLASRVIRQAMAIGERKKIKSTDVDLHKSIERVTHGIGMGFVEQMVKDIDEMARFIFGGHPLKARLKACRNHLINAVLMIGNNLRELIARH